MAGPGTAHLRDAPDVVLRVEHLVVEFPTAGGTVHAVSDVSFDLVAGETLGIVGESGCGKSTTARSIVQLPRPTGGSVRYRGQDLTRSSPRALRAMRPGLQMIFQDPISSLNPRRAVRDIVGEGLRIWGARGRWTEANIDALLEAVGIDPSHGDRMAHQFSGGQCQRISIARAIVLDPDIVICDEPVSALDVSVQAQILNLLEEMKAAYDLSLVFISHDLAVVRHVSDRVMVMYMGKICELATSEQLYRVPTHPYTRALMASIPQEPASDADPGPERADTIDTELPSALDPPPGCRFHTRCPRAEQRCRIEEPAIEAVTGRVDHWVACHFPHLDR